MVIYSFHFFPAVHIISFRQSLRLAGFMSLESSARAANKSRGDWGVSPAGICRDQGRDQGRDRGVSRPGKRPVGRDPVLSGYRGK